MKPKKTTRKRTTGKKPNVVAKRAVDKPDVRRKTRWDLTHQDRRTLVLSVIFEILKWAGITLSSQVGQLMTLVVRRQEDWLTGRNGINGATAEDQIFAKDRLAREVAASVAIGVELSTTLRRHEEIILHVWNDIEEDQTLLEIMSSFFSADGLSKSERVTALEIYLSRRMRDRLLAGTADIPLAPSKPPYRM